MHKGVVKTIASVPSVRDCEKMCAGEPNFKCNTYSFRYSSQSRDNCLLCDRPYNRLDIYADLEPDRDFDIYSMSDDPKVCKAETPGGRKESNARKMALIFVNRSLMVVNFQSAFSEALTQVGFSSQLSVSLCQ